MKHFWRAVFSICLLVWLQQSLLGAPNFQKTSSPSTAQAAASDFEEARKLFGQGSMDEALIALRRGLARSPKNVDALNLLGVIYHRQQRYSESVEAFRKALRINPRSVETLNNLAISYTTQGKSDLAEQTFLATLHLEPRNRTANYNLGLILLARHEPKEAITALERIRPADSSVLLSLTQAYLMARMKAQGLKTAEALSAGDSKDIRLHFSLGVLLASKREYGPAIHEFELANVLKPRTFEILHDLGQAYLRNGQPAKALAALEQALELKPDSADTLYLLAQSETDLRKDVEALDLLVRARKLAPQNTDILLLLARLSMKQSFYEDAITLLKEAIKIDPRRPDPHAALGESYFTVGKVTEALEEFKLLLQLDHAARSYAFMGLCHRHLGRYEEAKQYLNQGLKADPNDPLILFNLGFIARKQADYAQAEQYLGHALKVDPSYSDALLEMGGLKMEQKKYEEAIPFLRRCTEVSQKPAQAYYKLAMAERHLQQAEAAQRDLKIYITLSKNPEPGPYPLQNFFDYLDRRAGLSPVQRASADLHELEAEVAAHPDRPRSLYLLAEGLLKSNRVNDAMKVIERLDAVSGSDFRTLLAEGVLLARFRLYPAAIRHFQEALTANPASDEARYNLANAQFRNGDYASSLQSLQHVSVQAQSDAAYLALLGDTYAHLGRTAEAQQALRRAIFNSPENDQYYLSLALVQLRAMDLDRADATLRQGLARVPDSGLLHWGLGVVSVLRGNLAQGETYLLNAIDLVPSRESTYTTLGVFYYEVGRIAEARDVLQRYSEIFPHGSIDVVRIRETLDATSVSGGSSHNATKLSPNARQEFYRLVLMLAERDR